MTSEKYEVILNGSNYIMDVDGQPKKVGFYVTRYVQAVSPEEAELIAVNMIKDNIKLNSAIKNDSSEPPLLCLDEMYQIDNFDDLETLEPGFGFYEELQKTKNE